MIHRVIGSKALEGTNKIWYTKSVGCSLKIEARGETERQMRRSIFQTRIDNSVIRTLLRLSRAELAGWLKLLVIAKTIVEGKKICFPETVAFVFEGPLCPALAHYVIIGEQGAARLTEFDGSINRVIVSSLGGEATLL